MFSSAAASLLLLLVGLSSAHAHARPTIFPKQQLKLERINQSTKINTQLTCLQRRRNLFGVRGGSSPEDSSEDEEYNYPPERGAGGDDPATNYYEGQNSYGGGGYSDGNSQSQGPPRSQQMQRPPQQQDPRYQQQQQRGAGDNPYGEPELPPDDGYGPPPSLPDASEQEPPPFPDGPYGSDSHRGPPQNQRYQQPPPSRQSGPPQNQRYQQQQQPPSRQSAPPRMPPPQKNPMHDAPDPSMIMDSSNPSEQLELDSFNKDLIFQGLKRMYRKKILPLEISSKYGHFHSPPLSPSDFDAKPMVLLLGQYSVGKTSFIRYLLGRDFPGIRVGPEPTTDRFTCILDGPVDKIIPGAALAS